jgi:hypothetical protein
VTGSTGTDFESKLRMSWTRSQTATREEHCVRSFLVLVAATFLSCSSHHNPGFTTTGSDGVYRCCLPGDGTSCCAGTAIGTCFQYGGTSGACTNEGDELEGKDICAGCCEGLVRKQVCDAPPSVIVCTRCGNGTCGPGEDTCNCPVDCGPSTVACTGPCTPPVTQPLLTDPSAGPAGSGQ